MIIHLMILKRRELVISYRLRDDWLVSKTNPPDSLGRDEMFFNDRACRWQARSVGMHTVNPALTLPLAAALAMAPAAQSSSFNVAPLPPVSDPIGFAGAFAGVHRGHLIAGGGANFPDGVMPWDGGKKIWHERIFVLDLTKTGSSWKPAGKLPSRNGYGVSLTVEEGILIIGGSDDASHLAKVHLMTLGEDQQAVFRPLPSLPEPLAQMCGATVGRKIHIFGGIGSPAATRASNKHWILDLDAPAKSWFEAAPMPAAGRILATAAAVGNQFIVAGGCSLAADSGGKPTRTYLTDAWKFSGNEWSRLSDMPRASVAAASPAPVMGDSFFIISGDDGKQTGLASPTLHQGFTPEVLRFEIGKNRWTTAGNLSVPPPVTLPTAPWEEGCILFNGEVKPGVRTPQVFLFIPESAIP
jgi:N-acetylneuraminate epimerase